MTPKPKDDDDDAALDQYAILDRLPAAHTVTLPRRRMRPSVVDVLLDALPADPAQRIFMDKYKDHSRTAYHHQDDIWDDSVNVSIVKRKLTRIASRGHGRLPKDHVETTVADRDLKSPDNWVKRSPQLLRLTGTHPINAEPDPTDLYEQGFITPVSLHYVRNHGKTPQIDWNEHTLSISGLVENPTTWTMDELTQLPSTTIPVTTCCSGQRRKEVNMITKTVGFNWSTAAHSCNLWTGVKLATLLEHCKVDIGRGRFVWFEGSEQEDLPNGKYGTSIDLITCMSKFDNILLAYRQNGIPLHPDHGYPLRVIVPGYVGGRAVKWVSDIKVMDRPSDNFYHFHDNRILPPFVDAELAAEEGWFFRDEYVYNQLSINSVIVHPSHQHCINEGESGNYAIKGYAYSGGGRKITRVELTFDEGKTWKLCSVNYPEERYSDMPKYNKYFAWMFWEYQIPIGLLYKLAEKGCHIRVRAWDIANNTQPAMPTWNVLGQGNNSQYRVYMEPKEEDGYKFVEFLHPVATLHNDSGWMKKPEEPLDEEEDAVGAGRRKSMLKDGALKFIPMSEIAKHNTAESAWMVIDGSVFDVTNYLKHHPGGPESIVLNAGDDATEDFLAIHSKKARALLEKFYVGELLPDDEEGEGKEAPVVEQLTDKDGNLIGLHPKKWQDFTLIERVEVSHDSRLFKFKLQSEDHVLGLPCGYHMFLQATVADQAVVRAYTPVSSNDEKGIFQLCIKVYKADQVPQFPEGGKMTQYLEAMKIGDPIRAKGPIGHFEYKGHGQCVIKGQEKHATKFGLIAGGTGLTPCYQVLKAIFKDPTDTTEVYLVYANRREGDILMRKQLDEMAAARDNIHVFYTICFDIPETWSYGFGRITKCMLNGNLPDPGHDAVIGLCGPPLMITDVCIPALHSIGHKDDELVVF